jgi:hypothetical protein
MAFKIEPETVAGLCGTCRNAVVQTTTANRTRVICGGGDPTFVVREPLDRCSMYSKKEPPRPSQHFWILETAWHPVMIVKNGHRHKTFMEPDDSRLEKADVNPFAAGWGGAARITIKASKIGIGEKA